MIARLHDGLVDTMAWGAVILLFAVMLGIGLDVAARSMFDRPVGWVYEFVQHGMLLILFLGLPWLTRQREHISVDIVVDAVPPAVRRTMLVGGSILSAAVCAWLAWWAVRSTADNFARGVLTDGIYPIPRGALIAVIALGLGLSAVEFLRLALRMIRYPQLTRRLGDAELGAIRREDATPAPKATR